MGLKTDITDALNEAYAGDLADAYRTFSYKRVSSLYDTSTGAATATTTVYTVRGVLSPIAASMVDGETFRVDDVVFLILTDEFALTPKAGDSLTYAGVEYSVNIVKSDPANVVWELFSRAV